MIFLATASHDALKPVLSMDAPTLFEIPIGSWSFPVTNSMVYAWIIALLIFVGVRLATRRMQEVPSAAQNAIEALIEGLESFTKGLLDPQVARWAFPFIATFFIFILTSNYMGLLPGVGSLGYGEPVDNTWLPFAVEHVDRPLFRPPTADANMTLAMGLIFFVMSLYWAIRQQGIKGFLHHIFGVKGGMRGLFGLLLGVIFLMVGVIEVVSIMIRPVALGMRLYGNIYGGESVLTIMLGLLPAGLAAVPFYFFELIIATVQAIVFTILCIAFTGSMCSHSEEHAAEGGSH